MSLSVCNTIKAFDNSTLYTTISHTKLKYRLKDTQIHIPCARKEHILFCEKKPL